jgi:hypothetical protein
MARRKLDEKLQPITIRITPMQMLRLERVTAYDGLPTQDHIRRALDQYLNEYEKAHKLAPLHEINSLLRQAEILHPKQTGEDHAS